MMSVKLKNLPIEELPRERLILKGVKSLSNEELIAIILRTGTKNISVKDLANKIISNVNNISDLKDLNMQFLENIKGMGKAKSANLLAALERGKRVYNYNNFNKKFKILNAIDAYRYFKKEICFENQENFMVIYLNNQHSYISHKIIFKGTLNQSLVHPRDVLKEALMLNSNAIIIMHNHPSGVVTPSASDDDVTIKMAEAGNTLGVNVLDHIIVSNNDYYSYVEEGRMKYE